MRRIGTLKDGATARRFCDYLVTLKIDAATDRDGLDENSEWDIWIRNEEDVARARDEWAEFQQAPHESKYQVSAEADRIREEKVAERQTQIEEQRRQVDLSAERDSVPLGSSNILRTKQSSFPVTIAIIAISVIASLTSHFAEPRASRETGMATLEQKTFDTLSFVDPHEYATSGDPFASIKLGQWWRFITPMFLHGDEFHLAFNMLWMFFLGSTIERVQGSPFLLMLVLVTQAAGMMLQVMLPESNDLLPAFSGTPFAIGASGAVYGLFGYLWIRPSLDHRYPIHLVPMNVVLMMGWLFFCMTGAVGNVANGAHVGGLLAGIVVAVAASTISR